MAFTEIDKPSDYFNTKLYTGNGSTQSINGIGFQPDWVWIKERNNAASHKLYDIVRGATEVLESDGVGGEGTDVNGLTAFDSDGFSLGSSGSNNGSGDTYASWNWKAGGTASSNTDGSITSSVSANQDAGFSIVSYTGNGTNNDTATIGHGLGVGANFIIIKDRSDTSGWLVSSTALGWNNRLRLEGTQASASDTYAFGVSGVTPSSSTFTVSANSGDDHTNISGDNYIAYCFAEKKGFSKFGSYTGNGNADGTFVYTGFRPAWVLIKPSSAVGSWYLFDSTRNAYNVTNSRIKVDGSDAESSNIDTLDITSNGFKLRDTNAAWNGSGTTYIYMCFAENPLVSSAGVPCTAR